MTHPTRGAVDASQQVLIEALPPVLVLHVKRFYYDTAVGGVVKVGKPIKFGAELDVGTGTHCSFSFSDDGAAC
jgi:ubiquitin carboxyl-terminal hydrolase 10